MSYEILTSNILYNHIMLVFTLNEKYNSVIKNTKLN